MIPVFIFLDVIETKEAQSTFVLIYEEYKNLMYHIAFQVLGDQ